MGLRNMNSHFQTCNPNIKLDMLVQKIYMENEYFPILSIFQRQPFYLSIQVQDHGQLCSIVTETNVKI